MMFGEIYSDLTGIKRKPHFDGCASSSAVEQQCKVKVNISYKIILPRCIGVDHRCAVFTVPPPPPNCATSDREITMSTALRV